MDRAGELFEAQLSVLTTRNGEASKAWSAVGTAASWPLGFRLTSGVHARWY